jgi:hypothetical protein
MGPAEPPLGLEPLIRSADNGRRVLTWSITTMCRSCGNAHEPADDAREGDSHRSAFGVSARMQWTILGLAFIAALVSAALFPKSDSPAATRTDRVFAADLSRQADQAARLSADAHVLAGASRLRDLAMSVQHVERAHARLGRLRGGQARARASAAPMAARPFLTRAYQHAGDDQLLARIELAGGRDPALRARARRLQRDSRRMLIQLAEAERALTP